MAEAKMVIDKDGSKQWRLNGKLHREDGPAIEYANGTKEWRLNGEKHRIDGPAVEGMDGRKHWFLNGTLHRKDGPAIELANGTKEWYLNGKRFQSEEEFFQAIFFDVGLAGTYQPSRMGKHLKSIKILKTTKTTYK